MNHKKCLASIMMTFLLLTSCAARVADGGKNAITTAPWPDAKGREKTTNAQYLDLALRLAALELAQRSDGKKSYFFQYVAGVSRIEARGVIQTDEETTTALQPEAEADGKLIEAAIRDAIRESQLEEGFQPANHLAIRLEYRSEHKGKKSKNIAIFENGTIRWLTIAER